MANYSMVADATFNPFTYQELLHPVETATKAHMDLEEKLSELDAKANVWEGLADEANDEKTYKQYKKYANDLKATADALAKYGLNSQSKKSLFNLKSRYFSEITPIEKAYEARAEEAKEQRAGEASGMTYEGDASKSSLDRYLNNPQIRYNYANHKEGFSRLATVGQAWAKTLRDYKQGKPIDDYTNTMITNYGYAPGEVYQAISDMDKILRGETPSEKGQKMLIGVMQNEMAASGVDKWEDMDSKIRYFNRVSPALYAAVGDDKISTFDNYAAKAALNYEFSKKTKESEVGGVPINPVPLRNQEKIDEEWENINKYLKKKYIRTDGLGHYAITELGQKELLKDENMRGLPTSYGYKHTNTHFKNEFRDWLININGGNDFTIGDQESIKRTYKPGFGPNQAGQLVNKLHRDLKTKGWDAYRTTAFDIPIHGETANIIQGQWAQQEDAGKVKSVYKDRGYVNEKLDMEDKDWEGYKPTAIRAFPDRRTGLTNFYLKMSDPSNPNREKIIVPYKPDSGYFSQQAASNAFIIGDSYSQAMYNDKAPVWRTKDDGTVDVERDSRGKIKFSDKPMTAQDIYLLEQAQKAYLTMGINFGMQSAVTVNSKPTSVESVPTLAW